MSSKRLSRQKSVMSIESNPLETGDATNEDSSIKVEILTDAVPITSQQLEDDVLRILRFIDDNEARLEQLEEIKQPYTFTSDDLAKILEVTPSNKTRIAMIACIAPRLMDPAAKTVYFTGLFRFNEDKSKVEEILRARTQTLKSTNFAKTGEGGASMLQSRLFMAGRGGGPSRRGSAPGSFAAMSGRGGRGFGFGAGANNGKSLSTTNSAQQLAPSDWTLHSIKESTSGRQTSRSSSNLPTMGINGKVPPGSLSKVFRGSHDGSDHNSSMHSILSDDTGEYEVTDDLGLDRSKEDSPDVSPSAAGPVGRRTPTRRMTTPDLNGAAMAALRGHTTKPPIPQSSGNGTDHTDCEMLSTNNNSPSDCDEEDEELSIDISQASNGATNTTPFQGAVGLPISAANSVGTGPYSPNGYSGGGGGSPRADSDVGSNSLRRDSSRESMAADGSRAESPATVITATGEEYELKTEAAVIAPGFVITARAPQRGPTPPPRKLSSVPNGGSSENLSTLASSANSSGSNTPRTRQQNNRARSQLLAAEKEKEPAVKPKIASLRNMFERNPSTADGISTGGIAAAGIEDLTGPPSAALAAKQHQNPHEPPPKRAVSKLILNRVSSLKESSSNISKGNSAASQAALEAQAEIAAGKILRSGSHSTDDQDKTPGIPVPAAVAAAAAYNNNNNNTIHREEEDPEIGGAFTSPERRGTSTVGSFDDSGRGEFFVSPETLTKDNSRPNSSKLHVNSTSSNGSSSKATAAATAAIAVTPLGRKCRSQSADIIKRASNDDDDDDEFGDDDVILDGIDAAFSPTGSTTSAKGNNARSGSTDIESTIGSPMMVRRSSENSGFKAFSTTTTPEQRHAHSRVSRNSNKQFSFSCNNTPDKAATEAGRRVHGTDHSSAGTLQHANSGSISQSHSADGEAADGRTPLRRASSDYSMAVGSSSAKSIASAGWPVNAASLGGGSGKGGDVAAVCAAALKMSKAEFLALEEEGPTQGEVGSGIGKEFYSYRELVRRNYTKEYLGLNQTELEKYIGDIEFQLIFTRSKEEFYKQPRWRQMEQKKKAMMF